jgi:hypothetical protein
MAQRLTAGTALKSNKGAFSDSKWAAQFYSLPKVSDVMKALKKKYDLEDISALRANGSPQVLFGGFRLLRQRTSNNDRLTDLFKFLEKDGFTAEPD